MFLTIRFLIADLQYLLEKKEHLNLGGKRSKAKAIVRLILQIVITITILAACIPIVASNSRSSESKQIASGLLGTVVGYWFR
jgi:hypothetical protein